MGAGQPYTHMAYLRRAIEQDPSTPRYLITDRGKGYLLNGKELLGDPESVFRGKWTLVLPTDIAWQLWTKYRIAHRHYHIILKIHTKKH